MDDGLAFLLKKYEMKKPFSLFVVGLVPLLFACNRSMTGYVNPFVGTAGHGHTTPSATVPFGMLQPGPDTRLDGWDGCSGYHYSDDTIYGFSHTHLSGTGCKDYCDLLLMPFCDSFSVVNKEYCSTFSHRNEKASPGYYSVILDKNHVKVELTTTQRVAYHRYSYPHRGIKGFLIDLSHGDNTIDADFTSIKKENGTTHLSGYRRSAAWNPDQKFFFVIEIANEVDSIVFFGDDKPQSLESWFHSNNTACKNVKALVFLKEEEREANLRVAASSVDEGGAQKNLMADGTRKPFKEARKAADELWKKELSKIEVEGSLSTKRVFYTALYHCYTSPYLFNDADGRYRATNDGIYCTDGIYNHYTVFSLWDTYRALHPLLTLVDRARTYDFITTFAHEYCASGELPMWGLAGYETHCMIGYHAAPVMLEAQMAGILDSLSVPMKQVLLDGLVATSNRDEGQRQYAMHGYLSSEIDNESVSKTLEYAYDDWCIATMAKRLNLPTSDSIYKVYIRRAQSWKNVMDNNGFMHARRNGGFVTPFSPAEVNNHFTEANSWQYSTYVPQDVEGWIAALGGEEKAVAFLDSLFNTSSKTEGREQSDITGLIGQYAHGNEPSHHATYLYAYVGRQYKTAELVRRIGNEFYTIEPDGLIGNEDCGQMSAWYVLSALGFYEVCPGSGVYVIGSPLFRKATIHLENGKDIVIICKHQSMNNCYVQRFSMNGKSHPASYVTFDELKDGCTMDFVMSGKPNKDFGTRMEDRVHSPLWKTKTALSYLPMPSFATWEERFDGTKKVQLMLPTGAPKGTRIFYEVAHADTPDGIMLKDDATQHLYTGPFTVVDNCKLAAYAVWQAEMDTSLQAGQRDLRKSLPVYQTLTHFNADKSLTYINEPDKQYRDSGEEGLIDGIYGKVNYRVGGWQGWQKDMKVRVDLLESKPIHEVAVNCLSSTKSWIFLPQQLIVEVSDDGETWRPFAQSATGLADAVEGDAHRGFDYREDGAIRRVSVTGSTTARYVRITAVNYGSLPKWHVSAGDQAWLFCDEVIVG